MKKYFFYLVCLLAACTQQSSQSEKVNYQRHLDHFTVNLELADQKTTVGRCVALHTWGDMVPVGTGPYGCNTMDLSTRTVTIYATEPEVVDDAYTTLLGHELLHAYAGAYHQKTE